MKPVFGKIGVPQGEKKAELSGPELMVDKLVAAVELYGARFAWTCCTRCPCTPVNTQTERPDPTCAVCRGTGRYYFGPKDYEVSADVGELDDLQAAVVRTNGAAVIEGILQRATRAQDFYDVLGNWVRGTMMVSVRPENKLGYFDRLINLDSTMVADDVVTVTGPTDRITVRQPIISINGVFSLSDRYEEDVDFTVDPLLGLSWLPGRAPATGTRLSVHYLTYPAWLVIDHPHVLRESKKRLKVANRTTPRGTPVQAPLQATVRLEYLQEFTLEAPP